MSSYFDRHLPAPEPKLAAGLDKFGNRLGVVERDQSLVSGRIDAGLLKQRDGAQGKGDELAVRESVGDEITGGSLPGQALRAFVREDQRDGIKQNRRAAIDHVFCLNPASVSGFDATDFRRDNLHHRAFRLYCGLKLFQQRSVGARTYEYTDLAACEAFRSILDDAERWRWFEVIPWGDSGSSRLWQLFHAQLVGDRLSQAWFDVEEMSHHALPDHWCLDLGQLEGQCHDDVTLLGRCLTDEELPRLAVVIGEAFRAEPNLLALLHIGERPETPLWRFSGPSPNEFG